MKEVAVESPNDRRNCRTGLTKGLNSEKTLDKGSTLSVKDNEGSSTRIWKKRKENRLKKSLRFMIRDSEGFRGRGRRCGAAGGSKDACSARWAKRGGEIARRVTSHYWQNNKEWGGQGRSATQLLGKEDILR